LRTASGSRFTITAGGANTGTGGDGGQGDGSSAHDGATGGSGIVVVSYANTAGDATTVTGTHTFTNTGGNKIYKFTGSGSIRWGA
jgi:hypothetical protein